MAEVVTEELTTTETPAVETPVAATPAPETPATPVAATPEATPEPARTDPQGEAPEKYDLTLPEGSGFDANYLELFSAEARAMGLSNENAQALLTERATQVRQLREHYLTDAKADPAIGGANFAETQTLAAHGIEKVLAKFSTPEEAAEIQAFFTATGIGNHKAWLRLFRGIGLALKEDTPVAASLAVKPVRKSDEDVFFANSTSRPAA